jgi:hypothetical protein
MPFAAQAFQAFLGPLIILELSALTRVRLCLLSKIEGFHYISIRYSWMGYFLLYGWLNAVDV